MKHDPMSVTTQTDMLPPVRTRTVTPAAPPDAAQTLLPPVASGLFAAAPAPSWPQAAAADPEPVSATESMPAADPVGATAEETGEMQDFEIVADEITLEIRVDGSDEDLILLEADDQAAEPVEAEQEPGEPEQEAGESEPAIRETQPPLSPWDLGAARDATTDSDRAARARAEWESLGQALSDSLVGAGPPREEPGPHGYELTDEKAAELEGVDAVLPFAGPIIPSRPGRTGQADSPLAELVHRLETFTATLRAEGADALTRAQTGDDRFDALLASIAAGFLAGRGG